MDKLILIGYRKPKYICHVKDNGSTNRVLSLAIRSELFVIPEF